MFFFVLPAREAVAKQAVTVTKRMVDWRWGERFGNDFEVNKKILWKNGKRVRKGEQATPIW